MKTKSPFPIAGFALLIACATVKVSQTTPASGTELLQRMHDAYAGKWYKTVTFVQKTTVTRPNGVVDTSTWYEALKSPDRLRIDFGDPSNGNGALYTADSLYVVRAGKVTRTVASGNPFLPFVAGVYDQPVDTTVRQLAPYHFDLSKIRSDVWEGTPVYVVGASSASDLESPQFWIDRDRLIPLRFLVKLSPDPAAKPNDIRLEKNVQVGGGWLATHVAIMDGGVVRQAEDYSNWNGNVSLPADFFVAEKWKDTPHWAH
jgi:outer membrane lipoprotein-sorting protein